MGLTEDYQATRIVALMTWKVELQSLRTLLRAA
jgi:hypothetical protein